MRNKYNRVVLIIFLYSFLVSTFLSSGLKFLAFWKLTLEATGLTVPEISCHLVLWKQLIVFEFSLEMVLKISHQCTNEMLFQQILIKHLSHYIFRSKMQKEAKMTKIIKSFQSMWCWWQSVYIDDTLEMLLTSADVNTPMILMTKPGELVTNIRLCQHFVLPISM